MDVADVFPSYYYDDEYGDSAAFLLLFRPIRDDDAVVGFACFIDRSDMRRSAFEDDYFSNVSIDRSASVADWVWVVFDRLLVPLLWICV